MNKNLRTYYYKEEAQQAIGKIRRLDDELAAMEASPEPKSVPEAVKRENRISWTRNEKFVILGQVLEGAWDLAPSKIENDEFRTFANI